MEECVLTLTNLGYIKRQAADSYKTQGAAGAALWAWPPGRGRDRDHVPLLKPRLCDVLYLRRAGVSVEVLRGAGRKPHF